MSAQSGLSRWISIEARYYLLAWPLAARAFGDAVRSHWVINNQVHWVLDVAFREDQSQIRAGHWAANVAVPRHLARILLRQQSVKRPSRKGRRLRAAWDPDFLLQVLTAIRLRLPWPHGQEASGVPSRSATSQPWARRNRRGTSR
jgi:predicted transposase YbfD/YdcC